jgi:hypothetical protein
METPSLFGDECFALAMERAKTERRWLLVEATATWSGACEKMDPVWREPSIVEWVAGHALAIQVDLDVERDETRALGIRTWPTVILFRDGEEKDRIAGYRSPAALLEWFRTVESGGTDLDQVRQMATGPGGSDWARAALARKLCATNRFEEALDLYVRLLKEGEIFKPHTLDGMPDFMRDELMKGPAVLARSHPPAHQRFSHVRDEAAGAARAAPAEPRFRADWIVLNEILGDVHHSLEWLDAVKDDTAFAPALDHARPLLIPVLRDRGRWADIGRLYRDPLATLRREFGLCQPRPGGQGAALVTELGPSIFRTRAAELYRAVLAAGRVVEAAAVATEALRLDGSELMKNELRLPR